MAKNFLVTLVVKYNCASVCTVVNYSVPITAVSVYICVVILHVCFAYAGLDGSTSGLERERLINRFNAANNTDVHLFLLSTR